MSVEPVQPLYAIRVIPPPRLTVALIRDTVAKYYGVTPAQMQSPRRTRDIVYPRQAAMYLAKKLTTRSFPEIGRRFGNRDHTTVMHAVRQVLRRIEERPEWKKDIEALDRALSAARDAMAAQS